MSTPTRRMLIDFDAAIDMQIGYAIYLSKKDSSVIDKKFVSLELNRLRYIRFHKEKFMGYVFGNTMPYEQAMQVFKEDLSQNFEEIGLYAPKVLCTERMINVFSAPEHQKLCTCEVLARSPQEIALAEKLYPRTTVRHMSEKPPVDFESYARIIYADCSHLDEIKDIHFKHVAVIGYPDNFEVIAGVRTVRRELILNLSQTNSIEIVNPY